VTFASIVTLYAHFYTEHKHPNPNRRTGAIECRVHVLIREWPKSAQIIITFTITVNIYVQHITSFFNDDVYTALNYQNISLTNQQLSLEPGELRTKYCIFRRQ